MDVNRTEYNYTANRRAVEPNYDIVYLSPDSNGKANQIPYRLDLSENILITGVEGITGLPVTITTSQSIAHHGGVVTAQSLDTRSIIISGVAFMEEEEVKRRLLNMFPPLSRGTLIFNDEREIEVYVKTSPEISMRRRSANFTVRLLAPFPLFSAHSEEIDGLNVAFDAFRFDWNMSFYQFKSYKQGEARILNGGQFDCFFKAKIATDIAVQKKIWVKSQSRNGEERTAWFNTGLSAGETLEFISSNEGVKLLDNSRADVTGYIDERSDLFSLFMGENLITAGATGATANDLKVTLTYAPLFAGVII